MNCDGCLISCFTLWHRTSVSLQVHIWQILQCRLCGKCAVGCDLLHFWVYPCQSFANDVSLFVGLIYLHSPSTAWTGRIFLSHLARETAMPFLVSCTLHTVFLYSMVPVRKQRPSMGSARRPQDTELLYSNVCQTNQDEHKISVKIWTAGNDLMTCKHSCVFFPGLPLQTFAKHQCWQSVDLLWADLSLSQWSNRWFTKIWALGGYSRGTCTVFDFILGRTRECWCSLHERQSLCMTDFLNFRSKIRLSIAHTIVYSPFLSLMANQR